MGHRKKCAPFFGSWMAQRLYFCAKGISHFRSTTSPKRGPCTFIVLTPAFLELVAFWWIRSPPDLSDDHNIWLLCHAIMQTSQTGSMWKGGLWIPHTACFNLLTDFEPCNHRWQNRRKTSVHLSNAMRWSAILNCLQSLTVACSFAQFLICFRGSIE